MEAGTPGWVSSGRPRGPRFSADQLGGVELARPGDRVWLVADDVHALGPAEAGRHLGLLVMRGPPEASSCSAQELIAPDTEQSSHGPRVP